MSGTAAVLQALWLATWVGSLAIVLVLLLRKPVRRHFGAGIAYALWGLPAVAWLALLLPARVVEVAWVPMPAASALPQAMVVTQVQPAALIDMTGIGFCAWLSGVLLMLARMAWQQYRFQKGLGHLRREHRAADTWRAQHGAAGLPALVGLVRPKIVLPADVASRYDRRERALLLAHERVHRRRGDHWVNALVAGLRCVMWFNPLLHLASSRLRHDQELACDARVLAMHRMHRRAYAEAMLKTSMAGEALPLACHWGSTHPMKERLDMLKQATPPRRRRIAASIMLALSVAGTGFAAWSMQAPQVVTRSSEINVRSHGSDFQATVSLGVDHDGGHPVTVSAGFGRPFTILREDDGVATELSATVTEASVDGAPGYRVEARISRDGSSLGSPILLVRPGRQASVVVAGAGAKGDVRLDISLEPAGVARLDRLHSVHVVTDGKPGDEKKSVRIIEVAGDANIEQALRDAGVADERVATLAQAAGSARSGRADGSQPDGAAATAPAARRIMVVRAGGEAADPAEIARQLREAGMDDEAAAEMSRWIEHSVQHSGTRSEGGQRIERRIEVRRSAAEAPPAPPAPPAPDAPAAPPAPPAPPAPAVPPAPPAAPALVQRSDKVVYTRAALAAANADSVADILRRFAADTGHAVHMAPESVMHLRNGRRVSSLAPYLATAEQVEVLSDGAAVVINAMSRAVD